MKPLPALAVLLGLAALSACGGPPEAGPAADGTDYTACEDGTCEVAVSEPTDIVIDAPGESTATLFITAVSDDGIEFEMSRGNVNFSGSLGAACETTLSDSNMLSHCFDEGAPPEPDPSRGELVVQVLGMHEGSVVLRMAVN